MLFNRFALLKIKANIMKKVCDNCVKWKTKRCMAKKGICMLTNLETNKKDTCSQWQAFKHRSPKEIKAMIQEILKDIEGI